MGGAEDLDARDRLARRERGRRRPGRDLAPADLHFPPDLSVPLIVSGATVAQWEREDAAGSGDAAYALGVRLFQAGDLGHARDYLVRAAERGSAAGAYARYQVAGNGRLLPGGGLGAPDGGR